MAQADAGLRVRALSAADALGDTRAWDAGDRLVRLALLITGSPDRAHRLARGTLVAVGPDAPYQHARRKLLRRLRRVRGHPFTAGLIPGLAGLTPAARLWRRLMTLPATDRALVVLTEAEGLADSVAGAALGLPRGETERALLRVRETLQEQTQLTEAERREVFAGPALELAGGALPPASLHRVQRARRVRRAGSAVVALALVIVVWATNAATRGDAAPSGGEVPSRYAGETVRLATPAQWAARGDLVGDRALLHDALLSWRTHGMDVEGSRPVLVWAGRAGGGRLVVLAGVNAAGDDVVGALLDRGNGPRLASVQLAAPTVAVGFTGLDEDRPDSRRYLVAPWVSTLAVNDVASSEPTGAGEFVNLDLADGLSAPWSRPGKQVELVPSAVQPEQGRNPNDNGDSDGAANTCGRPVLRLTGPAPEPDPSQSQPVSSPSASPSGPPDRDVDDQLYALDLGDTAVVPATPPPSVGAQRDMYLSALRGLSACEGRTRGSFAGGVTGGADLSTTVVAGLRLRPLWSGRLADGTAGQVFELTWQVHRANGDDVTALAFAVTSARGPAQYSAVAHANEPHQLDLVLTSVRWTAGQAGQQELVVTGGPGLARVDISPRPRGTALAGRVALGPAPRPGQRWQAVGVDRSGRLAASTVVF